MNLVNSTKNYFIRWLDFKTRISRSEFWWGYLGSVIVGILVGICIGFFLGLFAAMMGWQVEATINLAIVPFQLYFAIAGLSLTVRRLHDLNKSGWWLLIILTIVGVFLLLYWYCKKGDAGENRFGLSPLEQSTASFPEEESV